MNGRRSAVPKSPRKTTRQTRSAQVAKSTTNSDQNQAPSRTAAKPIYSFFNNVAQRQRTIEPAPQAEQALPVAADEVLEAIHDDSDEEASHSVRAASVLSTSSSVASAIRKRKSPMSLNSEDHATLSASQSHKFRRIGEVDRVSGNAPNVDQRPWTDKFAPLDMEELAVHKRKVADVRGWLERALRMRHQRLLVLKGPSGAGKTTALKLLAKELDIGLTEWRNSTSSDFTSDETSPDTMRFDEFVNRAGRSAALTLSVHGTSEGTDVNSQSQVDPKSHESQMLLIEEFPTTFSTTSNALRSFRATVSQYLASPVRNSAKAIPMIMIISETSQSASTTASESFTAHRLLGVELTDHSSVDIIEFNPIAPTLMVKALELVVVKEARKSGRRKTPGIQVLQRLSEVGDVRSAVSSLEFLCLRGDEGETWSNKVVFSKSRQAKPRRELTKLEREALQLIHSRENSLGIFHSVGKIVYNKRTSTNDQAVPEALPDWMKLHERALVPENDTNELFNDLGSDVSTFIAAIHENFLLSCRNSSSEQTLESMHSCLDNLSDSDLLSLDRLSSSARTISTSATDGSRQDELCFQVATRGVLFNLPSPVQRDRPTGGKPGDAHKMFYPVSNRLWRKQEETEDRLKLLRAELHNLAKHTATSSIARSGTRDHLSGVETWSRSSFSSTQTGTREDTEEGTACATADVREGLLTDRLPYMVHILGSKDLPPVFKSFHDLALLVVRASEDPSNALGDHLLDDDVDRDISTGSTQPKLVTYGQKDVEIRKPSMRKAGTIARSMISARQTTSPSIEPDLQKLFLEDDDISDG